MALQFGKSPAQIWTERLWAALWTLTALLGELVLFALGSRHGDFASMVILSPLLAFAAWQLVSKATSGDYFKPRLQVKVEGLRELLDVIFTVACIVNAAVFVAALVEWSR